MRRDWLIWLAPTHRCCFAIHWTFPLIGRLLRSTFPAAQNFSRGDHAPFWQAGIPAIQITDTANFRYAHYHTATDTPEKLDYERLAAIVGSTAVAIAEVAGILFSKREGSGHQTQ